MLGVVNLDKPVGPTSHDMVGLLRRLSGTRRIGHAGTLDPLASGVLPILVGAATRFSEELTGGAKRYDAVIRLGQRSATDDAEGPILDGAEPPPLETVTRVLEEFVGAFEQRPPAFSARKLAGRRGHRAARAGEPLDLPPRVVTVEELRVVEATHGEGWLDLRIDLRCAAGTYVRSIARDLGDRLGCGGHLHALRRTEAAGLRVEDATSPERLEELAAGGRLAEALLPVGPLLPFATVHLEAAAAARFRHGAALRIDDDASGRRAVYDDDGELIGVGTLSAGLLQPEKVLSAAGAA
jgi:tRNA pseudouridine55 synthase